jgi:hypothetical protein
MTPSKTPRVAYVVQKVGWTFNDQWYYRDGMEDDEPITAYATRERAEAERLRLECAGWKGAGSPLAYGSDLEDVSSLTEAEFIERLNALGLIPERLRGATDIYWRDWWEMVERELTDGQRQALWQMMDRLRLYEIVAVEVGGAP